MPKRIQRKRTRGWRKPPNTIFVGRPSKYGNPYVVIKKRTGGYLVKLVGGGRKRRSQTDYEALFPDKLKATKKSVEMYKKNIAPSIHGMDLAFLKGKDIMCWCREDEPYCHGDVLLELANKV